MLAHHKGGVAFFGSAVLHFCLGKAALSPFRGRHTLRRLMPRLKKDAPHSPQSRCAAYLLFCVSSRPCRTYSRYKAWGRSAPKFAYAT